MSLSSGTMSAKDLKKLFNIEKDVDSDFVIALAGNPNTGKSTVFNALTGLHQHTGNWPGKTVCSAQGEFKHKNQNFIAVDLPGVYSLLASSVDEIIARDFLCFAKPDACLIVVDATSLERNLNLTLQILEITDKVIVCLNLMDEAIKKNININVNLLSKKLGVPVIPTAARNGTGIIDLKNTIYEMCNNKIKTHPFAIKYNYEISTFIDNLSSKLDKIFCGEINSRWLALRLIDGDFSIISSLYKYFKCDFLSEIHVEGGINE